MWQSPSCLSAGGRRPAPEALGVEWRGRSNGSWIRIVTTKKFELPLKAGGKGTGTKLWEELFACQLLNCQTVKHCAERFARGFAELPCVS